MSPPVKMMGPGLHVVSRVSKEKGGIVHVAIVDVGNRLASSGFGTVVARLLEFSANGLSYDPYDPADGWEYVQTIADEAAAVARVWSVVNERYAAYDLLTNNCEHFVSYVATGLRKSPQVRSVVGLLAGVGLVLLVGASLSAANRAA